MFYGAQIDLEKVVSTHLFLLCPNNSGSTYLITAIGTSRQVWSLLREGQHVFGFAGPSTRSMRTPLIWAANQKTRAEFSNPARYNWEISRRAWYFQASAHSANACVFATKAPPFLLIPHLLQENFENAKFVFMVRDPYATIEGITRRLARMYSDRVELFTAAAQHVSKCFEIQERNIDRYADRGIFFTYEDLCTQPVRVAEKIQGLVPELDDLNLEQKLPVKQTYNSPLHNFNAEQIARLDNKHITIANVIFRKNKSVFERLGYALLDV